MMKMIPARWFSLRWLYLRRNPSLLHQSSGVGTTALQPVVVTMITENCNNERFSRFLEQRLQTFNDLVMKRHLMRDLA
ncbi:hypothetical protein HanIR_Chr13g0653781 [Helianthus annuus]|nr:hypothetical protein HanIR_Chr13g0653781 [Helianthus annuus]